MRSKKAVLNFFLVGSFSFFVYTLVAFQTIMRYGEGIHMGRFVLLLVAFWF